MPEKRPKKPRRQRHLVGIQAAWSGGRWRWRARCRIGGRERVGALRPTQEAAHRDYVQMRGEVLALPSRIVTLEDGLNAVLYERLQRGAASMASIATLDTIKRAILRAWDGRGDLRGIATAEELNWYIRAAHKDGRGLRTIQEKDLPLLRAAFRAAGLDWPKGVRPLRIPPPPMEWFEPEEVVELVSRIRSEELRDSIGRLRRCEGRERAADLIELIACTGLRVGEVSRLRIEDVNLPRRELTVRNQKAGGAVERVSVTLNLVEPLERLIAAADVEGRLVPGGMSYLSVLFERWRRRLGEPRLSGRTLRHSFVTAILADTGDPALAQERARHRSLTTTARYIHALRTRRGAAVAGIEERFMRGPAPAPGGAQEPGPRPS